ncbi:cytidine deaminase-like protein [Fennellomyces sp. T-0311]|nr:cytidine deaminase-like protein [Fennellomyces sp. T-0311]
MKFLFTSILAVAGATLAATHATGPDGSINPCYDLKEQQEIDECYMRLALDHVLVHNPTFPFGALIVDHTTNEVSCYGANSNRKNKLLHGETTAFWNCTELYPSPTNNDLHDPGLDWSHQTLYTTGEPCPMCASQSIYRGVGRVVWGTSIPDINRSGRQQLLIEMDDVIGSAHMGGYQLDHRVPEVVGGVLKNECDHAFWCAFSVFRDEGYYQSMSANGLDSYITEHDQRFPCVTMPLFRAQYD